MKINVLFSIALILFVTSYALCKSTNLLKSSLKLKYELNAREINQSNRSLPKLVSINTITKSEIEANRLKKSLKMAPESRFLQKSGTNVAKKLYPSVPIDKDHPLSYYLPYFLKNRFVSLKTNIKSNLKEKNSMVVKNKLTLKDKGSPHVVVLPPLIRLPTPIPAFVTVSGKKLVTSCLDTGCELCESQTIQTCVQCKHGFFLQDQRCFTQCPLNFVAAIFRRNCIPNTMATRYQQLVFGKAFSTGSCKNLCGEISHDCSCHHTCMLQGTCCSDYNECERLVTDNVGKKELCDEVPHCELCDFNSSSLTKCGKCDKNFFLSDGSCTSSCSDKQLPITENRFCKELKESKDHQNCNVDNCDFCAEESSKICRKCRNGFFLFNDQCLDICPLYMRADRINWVCLPAPIFAWYWIFPSQSSCRDRCDRQIDDEMDCSCTDDCYRNATCCQDLEDFCPDNIFWK